MANTRKTVFPNGLSSKIGMAGGGTAGSHSVDTTLGLAVGDVLDQVVAFGLTTGAAFSSFVDLTSEFTTPIETANAIDNTSGTDTTGLILMFVFADQNPNG